MKHRYVIFGILFFLSAAMMFRQLNPSVYISAFASDTFAYTSWAYQFIESLKEGTIYPRWMPLNFGGYGSPTFILYPPLAFYLVAFLNFFTDSLILAMNIAKFLSLFFSGLGIFLFLREFYSERIALLSSVFYISFPLTIFDKYVSGGFVSTISLVWFSPTLLFIYRYVKDRHYKHIIYAGACYGGLILTHLVNAYMFAFVITSFIIYMSVILKRPKDLIAIPLIMAVGALISAAYVFPMIYERQFINVEAFIGSDYSFDNFFILPKSTYELPSGHFWPEYYITFVLFAVVLCIYILLFFLQMRRINQKENKRINAINNFFICISMATMFLSFGISTFVWEAVPFFKYIQFPVRWWNITVFAIAYLSAGSFFVLNNIYRNKGAYVIVVVVFLANFIGGFNYITSPLTFTKQELIPVKSIGVGEGHLPKGVSIDKINKQDEREEVYITKGDGAVEVVTWKSEERSLKIMAKETVTARIRTFNFPGWSAYIDDGQTEIKTEKDTAAILVDVPEGSHILELRFIDTPVRRYSKVISLLSCMVLVLLIYDMKILGNKAITG